MLAINEMQNTNSMEEIMKNDPIVMILATMKVKMINIGENQL